MGQYRNKVFEINTCQDNSNYYKSDKHFFFDKRTSFLQLYNVQLSITPVYKSGGKVYAFNLSTSVLMPISKILEK